jgi:hypothetical protein
MCHKRTIGRSVSVRTRSPDSTVGLSPCRLWIGGNERDSEPVVALNANSLDRGHAHLGLGCGKAIESVQGLACRILALGDSPVTDNIVHDDEASPTREFESNL